MKKSKEFDNTLDECLERLLVKGETIDQCLQSFPEQADELKPLLETALATRKASAIQPRPEFREKARAQLSSALQEMETKRRRHFFSWNWQPQWVTVVAIVLVLLLASGGTVAAASGSMPDEPLYPVKLATEQVRLVFTPSALGKAEFYADLADRRVDEIARMADENKPGHIERTARRLDTYLTKIADLSSTGEVAGDVTVAPSIEKAPLMPERAMGAKGIGEAAGNVTVAPSVEKAPLMPERAMGAKGIGEAAGNVTVATSIEKAPLMPERAMGAKGVGEAGMKGDRRSRLRTTVGEHAINHSARLRALLKTAPPSARPALLQAIDLSETGYEKASKSLERP